MHDHTTWHARRRVPEPTLRSSTSHPAPVIATMPDQVTSFAGETRTWRHHGGRPYPMKLIEGRSAPTPLWRAVREERHRHRTRSTTRSATSRGGGDRVLRASPTSSVGEIAELPRACTRSSSAIRLTRRVRSSPDAARNRCSTPSSLPRSPRRPEGRQPRLADVSVPGPSPDRGTRERQRLATAYRWPAADRFAGRVSAYARWT